LPKAQARGLLGATKTGLAEDEDALGAAKTGLAEDGAALDGAKTGFAAWGGGGRVNLCVFLEF